MSEGPKDMMWWRSPDVAFVDDGDRVVLLALTDPRASSPQVLAGSGAAIWRALATRNTPDRIAIQVARQFAASPESLVSDVVAFLAAMESRKLVSASLVADPK